MGEKRKGGAPKGNRNARKHGFYSKVLDRAEREDLKLASDIDGVDDEIALLRVKIKSVLKRDPENLALIMQASNTLAALVRTRFKITPEQQKGLQEAIGTVIRKMAIPLGVNIAKTAIGKMM